MKKYFLLLAAAASVLAVSCQVEQTKESVTNEETVIDDTTPMPVLFGSRVAQVKSPVMTKGVGGIDAWRGDKQQPLYIYGLERNADKWVATKWSPDANDPSLDEFTPFIDNVAAEAPNPGTGARDAINVYNKYATNGLADQEPYYYVEGKTYDFYGYYVDDAAGTAYADEAAYNTAKGTSLTAEQFEALPWSDKVETVNTPVVAINGGTALSAEGEVISSIIVENLHIDGSQDIMLAETDKDADWGLRTEYVSLDQIYSARAARRGVTPDLVFKHLLSRFEFHLFNGSATIADNDITIAGLGLASLTKAATGDLTIFGQNPGFEADDLGQNDPVYFPLREATANTDTGLPIGDQNATVVHPAAMASPIVVDNSNQVGESIMMVPGEASYDIKLLINQANVTAPGFNPAEQHITIDMTQVKDAAGNPVGTGVAEAGKKYVVTLIVYGLEKVDITVTLKDWEDGGQIEIDPDADETDRREEATITVDANVIANPLQIVEGQTFDLSAGVSSDNQYSNLEYTVSDPAIISVDANGVVTALAIGTANVIVNQPQSITHLAADEVTIPVEVVADTRQALDITASDITMDLRDSKGYFSSKRFRETIVDPATGAEPTNAIGAKTYVAADESVVSVDPTTGVIVAKAVGQTTVTLTVAENEFYKESTCTITVTIQ